MNQYLVTALVDFVLATVALRKRNNLAARALAFILFSAGFWSIELYLLATLSDLETLEVLFHVTRWGVFMIPPCFALLTWRLVGSRPENFHNIVILPAFIIGICLGLINLFIAPSTLIETDSGFLPQVDFIYYSFVVLFLWCFTSSIGLSIVSFHFATHREKQRAKWLLITISVSFIGGMLNIFLMPYDFYFSRYLSTAAHIMFVALLFYATVQHHLMDITSALSAGITRLLLLGLIAWSSFLIMTAVGNDIVVFILFLVVVLELYPRLLQWALPNTKRFLSNQSYDFEKIKTDFQSALNDCVSLPDFVNVLDHYLIQFLKLNNYSVLLSDRNASSALLNFNASLPSRRVRSISKDNPLLKYSAEHEGLLMTDETPKHIQQKLEEHNALLGFCVKFDDVPLALVMIGKPVNHSYFRYDDIRLFQWLQVELGQVFSRIHQLDRMQDQLEQAKKTLSLLGLMNHYHHDIKAPLAIIDGILSNDIYDEQKKRDIMLQQVERGSRLIATMAGILKGERNRTLQPLSLQEVVKDSLFLFSQGIDNISYHFADTPDILGDAEDLKILIINIVKNAIEAKQTSRELELTISTWTNETHVYLSIADNGIGMSPEKCETLWENVTSSKVKGSGIGLQAIKRIADEHAAEIEVVSQVGEGSEFVFRFPIMESEIPNREIKTGETNEALQRRKWANKPIAS